MQILRCLSLACATAMISSPLLLRADNEAQIRAREALEQKMNQMDTNSVTSTPPPTVSNPPPAPAPAKPKHKPAPPPPVAKPAPPVQQPSVSQSALPPRPAPTPASTRESVEFAPPPNNTQTDERLQNALQQRMSETAPPTEQQAPPPYHKEKKVANNPQTLPPAHPSNPETPQNPVPSTLPPLQGPPSSLSAAKQQQLDSLLQQYRADQITPQQYHEQRAKILSEP